MYIKANPEVRFKQQGYLVSVMVVINDDYFEYGYIEDDTVCIGDIREHFADLESAMEFAKDSIKKVFSKIELDIDFSVNECEVLLAKANGRDFYTVGKVWFIQNDNRICTRNAGADFDNLLDAFNAELDAVLVGLSGE